MIDSPFTFIILYYNAMKGDLAIFRRGGILKSGYIWEPVMGRLFFEKEKKSTLRMIDRFWYMNVRTSFGTICIWKFADCIVCFPDSTVLQVLI